MRTFISYAYQDRPVARRLSKDLSKHGISVQLADDILQPGDLITDKIAEEITKADAFIIILSRKSAGSRWLPYELASAISAESKGSLRAIIPIVTEKGAEIPFPLKDRYYVDFSNPRVYAKALQSLILSLKHLPDRTPGRAKESTKRQIEVALYAEMALKAEKQAYELHRKASILRTAGLFGMLLGFTGLLTLGILGIFLINPAVKWWLIAAMVIYFGITTFIVIAILRDWDKITLRHRDRK